MKQGINDTIVLVKHIQLGFIFIQIYRNLELPAFARM